MEHLSRALPTEIIFYLLRSIRSESLISTSIAEEMLDRLEIIIKWLQVSLSVNTTDIPFILKIQFVSRDLVPSDRATCTIASRVNFFESSGKLKKRATHIPFGMNTGRRRQTDTDGEENL